MIRFHEVDSAMKAPLETVLQRWYPAPFLKWLYETSLRQLVEDPTASLPQPERKDVKGPQKEPKKGHLVDLLQRVLTNQELGRRFFENLPRRTQELLTALTWSRQVNLETLEQKLGFQVVLPNPEERGRLFEPFIIPIEHSFLLVLRDPPNAWGFYNRSSELPNPRDYAVALPQEIRARFRSFLPAPSGYDLVPLAELPAGAGTRFDCTSRAIADIRRVVEYIELGHLRYTKAKAVAMPSLRAVHQLTNGSEFFPASDDSDLALLRTRLLSEGVAGVTIKARTDLLAQPDSADAAKSVILKVLSDASLLHENLLGHLANSQNRWRRYDPTALANLQAFFAGLPSLAWVSCDNLATYHTLRDAMPSLFVQETGANSLYANVARDDDPWSKGIYAGHENTFELVGEPLLKGYAFLLAAFGLAEVVFDPPGNTKYRRPKKTSLTPFDGLRYVRLTPWGEFVLGRRKSYDIESVPEARPVIRLDEDRLLVTCRNPDPLTELALGQFMERVAPGRYGLTAKSLLAGCTSRRDVEERIRTFRRTISDSLPAFWEAFFARTLARIAPLKTELDYVVLKLEADEELRRHFATDPVLRQSHSRWKVSGSPFSGVNSRT